MYGRFLPIIELNHAVFMGCIWKSITLLFFQTTCTPKEADGIDEEEHFFGDSAEK